MRTNSARPTTRAARTGAHGQLRSPVAEKPILIVEDDHDLRDALEYLLRACGYQVVAAVDGEDAIEHLRKGVDPCLILLDLLMPRKDGFQFRTEQLQSAKFAKIPTIAYSGIYTGAGLRQKAGALGITTVLEKPVDYNRLLDLIEQHCCWP
jgi:two-component system chemotaxis response regulator CheY